MSESNPIETLEAEVDPRSTELALAYIDRRLAEEEGKLEGRLNGTHELPLNWMGGFGGIGWQTESHLRNNSAANQEMLRWLCDEVIDGNPAWTEQLAKAETDFQSAA